MVVSFFYIMAINKSYYFQHDYNASNDAKILFLRQQLGMEGYGIYWFIIEQLAQAGGKLPIKIIPVLAMQSQTQETKVRAIIEGYDLFQVVENEFFSIRLNKHLEIREQLSESGKEGAAKRWGNRVAIGEGIGNPNAKERKEIKEIEEIKEVGSELVKNIANDVWKDQIWKEQMVIGLRLKNIEELKGWLAMFNSSVSSDRIENFNKYSYKKMSRGWILKQMSNGIKAPTKEIIRSSESAPLTTLNNGI